MSYTNAPRPPRPLPSEGSGGGGFRYASFQHRLGALALDGVLPIFAITVISGVAGLSGLPFVGLFLPIGWLIWSMILWSEGQTPAKKILKIRVRNFESGAVATWGHMAVREFLVPLTVGIASFFTYGIVIVAWIVIEIVFYFTKNCRTLRDLWVKTAVINEA